jgi:O-acetyl-ADP-ribose deacetylase (regulator of RNase III)
MLIVMPSPPPHAPDHGAVLVEVRKVRRAGVVRLRELDVPALAGVARELPWGDGELPGGPVEKVLRLAVSRMGGGTLQTAAEYSLGLAQGTRDWPAADRRRRAAQVYGVSVERFRKHHELMVLGQVAEQVVQVAERTATPRAATLPADTAPYDGDPAAPYDRIPAAHRGLRVRVQRRTVPVTVHVHSVDLLRDIDVVVSPSNTHFALPAPYKSSVSATLRRAGAHRDPMGGLVDDHIHDELRGWAARHGAPGRAALPGTVAVTSAGALAGQGIRRIYHVAVAVPRPETNDYDVQPADVTRGVARVFALLAEEAGRHDPPLRSVCLPLLGAGRGGLPPLESFGAVWAAVEAELARGADWDIHFVVRRHARADLLERLLAGLAGREHGQGQGHGSAHVDVGQEGR